QKWVDDSIKEQEEGLITLEADSRSNADREKQIEELPEGKYRDQQQRDLTNARRKVDEKLLAGHYRLYFLRVARKYIYNLLPKDPFLTLALVIGLVVAGVVFKCFFEFGQESLVGSVVNLSLFDLRNRFYRNVIHLDVDQFSEQGSSELLARFTN